MIPVQETDHEGTAIEKLTSMFRGKARIEGLLRSLVAPIQDLEDVFFAILDARILDNSIGHQLDMWGAIVREDRQGRGDDDYRAAIRLRIRVNRSEGTAEDLIAVARLAFPEALERAYYEGYPAGFRIDARRVTSSIASAVKALRQTRAGGVDGTLVVTVEGELGWLSENEDLLAGWSNDPSVGSSGELGGVQWAAEPQMGGLLAWARTL